MPRTIARYDLSKILQPAANPADARTEAVTWGPNLTVVKGRAVGVDPVTKDCYPYGAVNDVQRAVIAGTMTAGLIGITVTKSDGIKKKINVAYNANAATIQTALNAYLGTLAVVLTGTPWSGLDFTFSGTNYTLLEQPDIEIDITGATGATDVIVTRDPAAAVTVESCCGLAQYTFKTDADGMVYLSDSTTDSEINTPTKTSPIFVTGTFDPADLTGFDAAAQRDLYAKTTVHGFIRIP